MSSKAGIFIEYLWLIIAVASFIAGIHQWYTSSFENSSMLFIMVFISVLMYGFRRRLRKKQSQKTIE